MGNEIWEICLCDESRAIGQKSRPPNVRQSALNDERSSLKLSDARSSVRAYWSPLGSQISLLMAVILWSIFVHWVGCGASQFILP